MFVSVTVTVPFCTSVCVLQGACGAVLRWGWLTCFRARLSASSGLYHTNRGTLLSTSSKLSISEFPSKYQQLQDPSVSSHSPAPGSVGMLLCAAHHTLQSSFRYTPTGSLSNLSIVNSSTSAHICLFPHRDVCHTAFCCLIIILKQDEQKNITLHCGNCKHDLQHTLITHMSQRCPMLPNCGTYIIL